MPGGNGKRDQDGGLVEESHQVRFQTFSALPSAEHQLTTPSWISKLPGTFRDHGLEVVAVQRQREHPWQLSMYMNTWCGLSEEFANGVLRRTRGPGAAAAQLRVTRTLEHEIKEGSAISQMIQTVVGRKPEGSSS